MSVDIQMFVLCDHLVVGVELTDPTEKPKLSTENNLDSQLAPGTYYVAYTYINRHDGETIRSPFSKIYVKENRSLNIELPEYYNESLIKTKYVYVGYSKEDLTSTQLTDVQFKRENDVLDDLFFQENLIRGTFKMTEFKIVTKRPPLENNTKIANYTDRIGGCPKCFGKGYYYDIYFNNKGQAVTATKSDKLLQECLKVLIDERLGNRYHPLWGCDVDKRIGTKNKGSSIDILKVEMAVKESIERLKRLQMNNRVMYMNMNDEEIIDTIESITVKKDGPTGYNVEVVVISMVGEMISYDVRL